VDDRTVGAGGFNRLKACRHGDLLFNINDRHIARSLDLYGEWAEAELALLGLFLKPGDLVIDVGANIGTHTVFFAKKVGPAGKVLAFEPQRIVFQTLCANLALNGLLNVHAFQAAAARHPGTIVVPPVDYATPGNHGGVRLDAGAPEGDVGERVSALTLDDLWRDLWRDQVAHARCRLLKIDVEGMEGEVLEGARLLITSARPILYVENNDAVRSPALIAQLLALDYRLFWHVSPFFNPRNFFGNADNVFGEVGDLNMVGVGADLAPLLAPLPAVTGPDDHWESLQRRLPRRP
jgi:FkbM family methyltransferase